VAESAAYSIGNPTPEEQLFLELLNRARANPTAEGVRLAGLTDSNVVQSYRAFGVSLILMQSQFAAIPPLPPLSLNPVLSATAREHSRDMLQNHFQGHNSSNGSTLDNRIAASGYALNAPSYYYGENVFSYSYSVVHGHAGFEVDWGGNVGTGGMQSPPGHRNNIHSANFREVGLGVVLGSNQGVGPQLVTQDFGSRSDTPPLVTGVIYRDRNGNRFYDIGEGVSGVSITIAGSSYFAVSGISGGYTVPVPHGGTYTVSFSGGPVPSAQRTVTTSGPNVKLDYIVPPVTGPVRGDFNGDGFADFLLFSPSLRRTAIWNLQGTTLLNSVSGPTLPTGWAATSVADLDRNGKLDLILSNASTRQTAIWFLNNATFVRSSPGPTLPIGWSLIAVTDVNRDGKPDYVIANANTGQTAVWFLNGTVLSSSAVGPSISPGWRLVDAVDFNADGKPDFVVSNTSTRSTAIWYMNGVVRTSSAYGPALAPGWVLQGASDFNSDGKPDYVLTETSTRRTVFWYLNGVSRTGSAYGPTLTAGYNLASP
jgi:hypothetical protein